MASLRDTVKDYQDELRDGIAWVAFWKQGRSWNAEYFHLDMDDTLYPEDRSRLEEIKSTDPAAVILNGYYCGHLGEDMSLDELTAGVRYHYENSMNDIDGFIGAHDDRLPPEVIEEARAAAHEAGLPFSEKPYRDGEDFNPYVFDGSMSIEDFELMHRMIEKERSEQMAEPILSGYLSNLGKYTEGRPAGEWVTFPTTAEHLKEVFDRIGIDFKHYEEWHFTEFQSTIPGLTEHLSEYSHPDELNYLGKLLEMQFDDDREKFIAAIEYGDHADSLQDIINLAQNLDCYYHLEDKRIAINEGMSELQTLKTAIHEIAHAKLHDIDLNAPKDEQQPHVDRRTREVEAESVAYTVCQHYGLDTSDYSFGYVAGWSSGRELSELKSSLETIRSAAAEIINSIDANFAELQKAQDKEQTAGQEQPTREGQEAAPQPEAPKKADTAGKEKPEAAPKEAFTPETIYRVRRNPYSDSRENSHLLQAYVTQENGRAKMGDVLYTGTPEKCRELMGQLKSGELTEGDVKQLYAKAQETAQTTGQDKDTFSIYQIKGGDETRDFRFEPYDRLQAAGNVVDKANYELVYSAPLAPETSLEDIYTRFNIDHPKDFKGHSLSVSDVVVLHQNGQDAAHFVDSVGFRQVPEFLQEQKQLTPDELTTGETIQTPRGTFHVTAMSREQIEAAGYGFHHQSDDGKYLIMGNGTRAFAVAAEQPEKANPLKHIEDTVEQNDNNFDGIINNTPTVDELEAKVKAGETISLVDLANAVKADKERGKEAKPEKKPSIRAQLRADKEKAQKKNAKQKLQDLERS